MSTKQEALKVIRDAVGDSAISYNTTITALSEDHETDIIELVDALESEFGVELYEELLDDVETIGELCTAVAKASRDNDDD